MAKGKSTPFKQVKGILKGKSGNGKGNNPNPVRKVSNRKVC